MAVMRNSIIFGGVDSADYGIYIGGEGTFNAPKRDVEMISIPGRNGAFALDKGRFENIEVTYSAFNYETDLATFSANLDAFRNAICSQSGYQRLTDSFHPDEYRMATYNSGLEVKPVKYNTAAEFDIVFDCKPQRFLTSGEDPITIGEWHETKTVSGTIAEFEAVEGDGVKSLVVDIEPYQSGSGTPSPDNVRPISGYDSVVVTVADDHDSPTVSNAYTTNLNGTRYGGTLDVASGVLTVTMIAISPTSALSGYARANGDYIAKIALDAKPPINNGTLANVICNNCQSLTANAQWNDAGTSVAVGKNNNTGELIMCVGGVTNKTAFDAWLSANSTTIVYELATPTTVQLTAQEVELLVGLNQVWANSGDVSVEYGTAPNVLINPTLFASSPMLEVEGYGEIDVNGEAITLQNITFGKIPVIEAVAVNKTDTGVTLTMPVKIDTSNLNQYDWFRLEDITATVRFTNKAGYVTDNCSTATGILTTATTNTTGTLKTVKAYGQSFHYGTPQGTDVLQPSAGFIDRWTYEGVTSYHVSEINMEITYDGNDMVTVELAVEVSECFDDTTEKVLSVTNSIGNSTKSALGHPTYIDLDIGEAWNSDSGTAVSLNNVVQIPAKLPTLKAGANEITFDNTVTDLKIVPRWWKV